MGQTSHKKHFTSILSNRLVIPAFFLPVLIWGLAFAVAGVFPFGGNAIPVIDMYHQFVPFLAELQDNLQTGGSLLYSWNGAGGFNFLALLAYYGASPLNLILVLFPKKLLLEGVLILLLLKIGLAGAFMFLFLDYISRAESRTDGHADGHADSPADSHTDSCTDSRAKAGWTAVAFACLYAGCSYLMAYYWCIMWIDVVALFPLCMLGLYRLAAEGKAGLYTVSLALIVFVNYYIAIMVCIFIFFFWPVLYFTRARQISRRDCLLRTLKAAGYSVLGVAMASVMLLPTYLSMQNAYYISSNFPDSMYFYSDALDVVNQLLPFTHLTYREGLPNLYCGMLVVVMLALYFSSKRFPLKEKLIYGAFFVFLFFSLNTNVLDFIWHGLHFPNQLPFRWTFMICFLLIYLAYRTFSQLDEMQEKAIWGILAFGTGYYLIASKLLKTVVDEADAFLYGGLGMLVATCAILLIYKKGIVNRRSLSVLVCCLVTAELCACGILCIDKVGTVDRAEYLENYDDVREMAEYTETRDGRTEMDMVHTMNDPALYHFRGMSQFSSSLNAKATTLMEKIGLEGAPEKNRYNYNTTSPVTNAMLNIRYMIAKQLPLDDPDFTLINKAGDTSLYESKYPLAIAYMLPESIRTWDVSADNPFMVLDDYVRAATDNEVSNVFKEHESDKVRGENVSARKTGSGVFDVSNYDKDEAKTVWISYKANEAGKYYVFIETYGAESIIIHRKAAGSDIEVMEDCGSIVNAGALKKNEEFSIEVQYEEDSEPGTIHCHVCTLDQKKWDKAYEMISRDTLQVSRWDDRVLQGRITASEDGMLTTSIPYEKGWKLKVDGHEREISELAGGAFISAWLSKGTHDIQLTFMPPGFIPGLLISILCILILMALQKLWPRIRTRQAGKQERDSDSFAETAESLPEESVSPQVDEPLNDVRDLF